MVGITGICAKAPNVSWTLNASDGTRKDYTAYDGPGYKLFNALCRGALIGRDDAGWFIDGWADPAQRWADAQEAARAHTIYMVRKHLPQFFPAAA